MYDYERNLEARMSRRLAAEDRYLTRLEKREEAAEALIGELVRMGEVIYYINVRSKDGILTGATKEFIGPLAYFDAIEYLLRNNYV